jgi:hypothetical protein
MRSDLGRLGAIAEILQVGPILATGTIPGEHSMRVLGARVLSAAALVVWLVSPAYAQSPSFSLAPEAVSKTPAEKEAEAERDKAYRESLKKIPDAKGPADPWGAVRSVESVKETSKASVPAKPRTKTGSTAN